MFLENEDNGETVKFTIDANAASSILKADGDYKVAHDPDKYIIYFHYS